MTCKPRPSHEAWHYSTRTWGELDDIWKWYFRTVAEAIVFFPFKRSVYVSSVDYNRYRFLSVLTGIYKVEVCWSVNNGAEIGRWSR